jgi:hypothetical protein
MGDVPVPRYQTFWTNKLSTLKSEYQTLVQQYPEADAQLKQLLKVLGDIEDMARHNPASVGESVEWAAEENGASYCKGIHGNPLFSALYGMLHKLKAMLKVSTLARQTNIPKTTGQQTTQEGSFEAVHRRKQHTTDKTSRNSKKVLCRPKRRPH